MKKVILLLLITFNLLFIAFFGFINFSYANNNSYDSEKVELITNYIYKLKREINVFKNKYEIKDDNSLEFEITQLNNILKILNNLDNYDSEKAEKIYILALEKIKVSKNNIKEILKYRKYTYEKKFKEKKDFYIKVTNKLNSQLNDIIKQIYSNIEKKSDFNENDKMIINILKKLNEENIKLKNFNKTNFATQSEMSNYVIELLRNVKNLMIELKKYN